MKQLSWPLLCVCFLRLGSAFSEVQLCSLCVLPLWSLLKISLLGVLIFQLLNSQTMPLPHLKWYFRELINVYTLSYSPKIFQELCFVCKTVRPLGKMNRNCRNRTLWTKFPKNLLLFVLLWCQIRKKLFSLIAAEKQWGDQKQDSPLGAVDVNHSNPQWTYIHNIRLLSSYSKSVLTYLPGQV